MIIIIQYPESGGVTENILSRLIYFVSKLVDCLGRVERLDLMAEVCQSVLALRFQKPVPFPVLLSLSLLLGIRMPTYHNA